MASNFIYRVLVAAAAEAAAPTAPSAGSNIASITGWTAIGSTDRGDDANLDADSVDISCYDEVGIVMPPVAIVATDIVAMQNGVESFELACYDSSEALLTLASDMTFATNVGQKTLSTVYRSVVIEVNGLYYDYFPRVLLSVTTLPAGIAGDGQSKTKMIARVTAGATITTGHKRVIYQ